MHRPTRDAPAARPPARRRCPSGTSLPESPRTCRSSAAVGGRAFRQRKRQEIRPRIAPDVVIEERQVVLHHRPLRAGLGDAMAEALVDDHVDRYAAILEPLPEL